MFKKMCCIIIFLCRVATHSGNFQVEENLRETQGSFDLFFKLKENLRF